VRLSPEGVARGESLDDLTPETYANLVELAQEADVDLGINSTSKGGHEDPGHAAGTAVDIGWINGQDIGNGDVTFEGMGALAEHVQKTAARLFGNDLKRIGGNLGPTGQFLNGRGPIAYGAGKDRYRRAHANHIHLSWAR
jgi:hypothetical protein